MAYRAINDLDEGDLEVGSRVCVSCEVRKPMPSFNWVGKAKKYRFRRCTSCNTKIAKERRNGSPEATKLIAFKNHIRKQYGISYETYQNLLSSQNNRCKICLNQLTDPQIDHCHITGKVRGILCFLCNTGIGKLRDSVDILRSAIAYLEAPRLNIEYISKQLTAEEISVIAKKRRAKQGSQRTKAHSETIKGRTKLTESQVLEIRSKYSSNSYTQQQLADEYGTSQALIWRIVKRRTWTHL